MGQDEIRTEKHNRGLSVWGAVLLFVAGFLLFTALYTTIAFELLPWIVGKEVQNDGLIPYIMIEGSMLLAVLTPAVILLRLERRPFSDLGLGLKGHSIGLLYGTLCAVLLYAIGFGWSLLAGSVEIRGIHFDWQALGASWFFYLLVSLTEECLVRGFILGHLLRTRLNKFLSLLLTSLLFGALHLTNPNIAFLPMLNLVLAGILLGSSFLYTRNLCFPIALHLFWNWIQGPILGYEVSGNKFTTSMLSLHLPEEDLINGGAFGFEGSLVCTVLLLIFIPLIIWWGEKREAIANV
ncbi:CPBP family intramembrane glutamic endopeptidase [Bacteroides reticulotermitis]|uniref:Metal-dependent membrane protease n=2 Tax=Bacteroides reticulotermitis TaxID=1133319 RepID=W4UU97_9BACE|nr:CPBP family intramembrane glutamic endopeptidase [Bacteroides reticulotermitis]MBB4045547.1 hypothetical protein [Bacteroides reticulotermitis]GAE84481.1 metal-dependent membrane protease [Bacteroides reticulotermitis JCM 10512]HJD75233.1 CPBP family intramembrane metalloprotease [Bacteroides reticulotermitis]